MEIIIEQIRPYFYLIALDSQQFKNSFSSNEMLEVINLPKSEAKFNAASKYLSKDSQNKQNSFILLNIDTVTQSELAKLKLDKFWPLIAKSAKGSSHSSNEIQLKNFCMKYQIPSSASSYQELESSLWDSNINSAFKSKSQLSKYISESHPLNDYYILSSHNTYLNGNQIISNSSLEYYITSLRQNCRCIEIDIWNTLSGGPIVSHGVFLTTSLQLDDVLNCVKENAFKETDLPLILSVEIHCNKKNQLIVKNMFENILGDLLLTKSLQDTENDTELPQLALLKRKILVKIKRSSKFGLTSNSISSAGASTLIASESSNLSILEQSTTSYSSSTASLSRNGTSLSDDSFSTCSSESDSSQVSVSSSSSKLLSSIKKFNKLSFKSSSNPPNDTFKIIPELCELSYYIYGVKFKDFGSLDSKKFNHCYSFSNVKLHYILKNEANANSNLFNHNLRHLTRIYPAGYKLTSRNYSPINFWKFGCQMVATNWQTSDVGQLVNESMFKIGYNEYHGMVLKPEYLQDKDSNLNITDEKRNKSIINTNIDQSFIESMSLSFEILAVKKVHNDSSAPANSNWLPALTLEVIGGENRKNKVEFVEKLEDECMRQMFLENHDFDMNDKTMTNLGSTISKRGNKVKTIALQKSEKQNNVYLYNCKFQLKLKDCLRDFLFIKLGVSETNSTSSGSSSSGYSSSSTFGFEDTTESAESSEVYRFVYLSQGYKKLKINDDYEVLMKINEQ